MQKVAGSYKRSADAVDWFIDNSSCLESEEEKLSRWNEWCRDPCNCAEFREIVEMRLQLLLHLSPPSKSDRETLVADSAVDYL